MDDGLGPLVVADGHLGVGRARRSAGQVAAARGRHAMAATAPRQSAQGDDDVPTVHPHVQVGEHVAVVEPATGVVLHDGKRRDVGRPQRVVVDDHAGLVGPAVAVQVEGVEVVVDGEHVPVDGVSHLGAQRGGVARVGPPVDAGELLVQARGQGREGVQEDEELLVGDGIGRLADDQPAEHALEHRERVHRPVVVVEPRALGAGARLPHVLEACAHSPRTRPARCTCPCRRRPCRGCRRSRADAWSPARRSGYGS